MKLDFRKFFTPKRIVPLFCAVVALSASQAVATPLTDLTLPAYAIAGTSVTATLNIGSAQTSNITVSVSTSSSEFSAPSQVEIPAGRTSATFTVKTLPITKTEAGTVTAKLGSTTLSAPITATYDQIKSLTFQPGEITGGLHTFGTVTLASPAPLGGWPIAVKTSTSLLTSSPTLTVPAGATSMAFSVRAEFTYVFYDGEVTVTDPLKSTASAQVDVNPFEFVTFDGPFGSPTTVNGISSSNIVVGFTTQNSTNYNFEYLSNLVFVPINLGDPAGSLNALNKNGVGVGVANGTAFSLSKGVLTSIAIPNATSSVALGISDQGVIVGQYTLANGTTPGFVDVNGQITTLLPTANSMVVNPQGVNNAGLVVGFYSLDGVHQHGFTYNINTKAYTFIKDPSTSLTAADGLVLTQFLGINDGNALCGYYQTNNGSQYGFVYNLNANRYIFMNDPFAANFQGVQITQIVGINNNNEIAGFFIDGFGQMHGFTAQ